jgi:hypothetical protein
MALEITTLKKEKSKVVHEYFHYKQLRPRKKRVKLDNLNNFLYEKSLELNLSFFLELHPTKGFRRKSHKRVMAGILTEQMKRGTFKYEKVVL